MRKQRMQMITKARRCQKQVEAQQYPSPNNHGVKIKLEINDLSLQWVLSNSIINRAYGLQAKKIY